MKRIAQHGGSRGHAAVEMALMSPWLFLLFAGIVDFGFYSYAAIVTANAARVAALYTSSDSSLAADQATACTTYVLPEMNRLPNTRSLSDCSNSTVTVTATSSPSPCVTRSACDTVVQVTYKTDLLLTVPGLINQMTITRTATMKVNPDI